ncbi:MAG: iron-sulfur cluster repair di-iron protein, partial [Actinomycetota bacterium]
PPMTPTQQSSTQQPTTQQPTTQQSSTQQPTTDPPRTSPGDLVAANPATARILQAHGLDFCCHGERPLDEACAEAGVDVDEVAGQISGTAVEGDTTWSALGPDDLAMHIVATHHRYLWEELPLLDALAEKVATVHGERHAELVQVRALVAALKADLEPHMAKEEQVLFPAIAALAVGDAPALPMPLANPVRVMLTEHDQVGELLAQLRTTTADFAVPADGCASYASLYERLEALEADTHLHVLKENHTLFPAALELDHRARSST